MKNIMMWTIAHSDDVLFFAVCGTPVLVALALYMLENARAWNRSIARRRLVFLLKFFVWLIACGLKNLSKKMLEFVLR